MNGNVLDPSLTRMNRELAERAQDKQAAVAMRGQDLQVGVNKASLAVTFLSSEHVYNHDATAEAVTLAAKLLEEIFADRSDPTDPLAGIPNEVVVRA